MAKKRPFSEGKWPSKKVKKQKTTEGDGSNEEVLRKDIITLLKTTKIADDEHEPASNLPELQSEVNVTISELSSTGDGLAVKNGHLYVAPFTAPGDIAAAKVYHTVPEESYSLTDLVKVVTPSKHRTETPKCKYFTTCSGCQFQHLPYSYQLAHKKSVVEKAYRNFSKLPAELVPEVGETIGSPLQYGYRTKLTPHFDEPQGARRDRRHGSKVKWSGIPPIGFIKKGTRKTMDIEDCPIGTEAVRIGMKGERKRVADNIDKYQRGATLLLRENTRRVDKTTPVSLDGDGVVLEVQGEHVHVKNCITDSKATSTEYVDDFRFDNPAGSFFQNNNSILPLVTQYIRDNIISKNEATNGESPEPRITNLIDAYCGSGLFTVTLSSLFKNSIGIDISLQSIDSATKNSKVNNLVATKFLAADANSIFDSVNSSTFPPAQTAVVIDPPRKGCDQGFLKQLMRYGPARICYVSCNVHTQARDVGVLAGDTLDGEGLVKLPGMYEIESLRGFDFFPQTSHVEGVAILKKKQIKDVRDNAVERTDEAAT